MLNVLMLYLLNVIMYSSLWFHFKCCILKLEWFCVNSHRDFLYSPPFYGTGFAVNYIMCTWLLVFVGQFNQFKSFCRFFNLKKPSSWSIYRNQRLYAIATIEQHYIEMRNDITSEPKKQKEVVICGDGHLDSSGWSATKGTYTFMDYNSKNMINMEFEGK